MKTRLKIVMLAAILLAACSDKKHICNEVPAFAEGDEVKMKASNLGKKAVVLRVIETDCEFSYEITYFTLWETRRVKIVSGMELEK